MLKLNETPVRTANNFRINNIEIDAQIPENIPEFENVQIVKQNSKIDENVSESQLVYGNDKELENMVLKKANSKIRIENNEKIYSDSVIRDTHNNKPFTQEIKIYYKFIKGVLSQSQKEFPNNFKIGTATREKVSIKKII